MKKILCLILIIVMALTLVGCGKANANSSERIQRIYDDGLFQIYKDTETGVHYLFSYQRGGLTVMFNADGTPYTGG